MKRFLITILSLLIIAVGSSAFAFDPGAPNQNPTNQPPDNQNPATQPPDNQGGSSVNNGTINGTYSILAVHSGKALDVYEWGITEGTNIVQWDLWGGEVQQFKITPVDGIWHRITPVIALNQAVDVAGASVTAGANIQIWTYWGGECQQFRFQSAGESEWRIIARNSGMCLDVLNSSIDDGANVIQSTCRADADNQIFELVRR